MRTFNAFVVALALMASACGAPAPVSHPDGGLPPSDVQMLPDSGPVADVVVNPTDNPPPADVPVTPGDVPTPPPDTAGPTNSDLPGGAPYNPETIICMNRLNGTWGFPRGAGDIAEGTRNDMHIMVLTSTDVPMTVNSWTWSVVRGEGAYWNNFGNMSTEVHCRMTITNTTTCDLVRFDCWRAGQTTSDPPMSTVISGFISL